ncbi:replication/maintenance protein RepL [Priestia megaterium]
MRAGTYQVNPDKIFKGGKNSRLNVLMQYNEIDKKEDK